VTIKFSFKYIYSCSNFLPEETTNSHQTPVTKGGAKLQVTSRLLLTETARSETHAA